MKTLAVLLALLLGSIAHSQTQEKGSIQVNIPNLTSDEGVVLFALYNEANFLKPSLSKYAKSEILEGNAMVTFTNISPGTYSILVLHDKNENMQMDFDENGMPKENYGSTGDSSSYGPPSWEDTKFEYAGDAIVLEIKL